MIDFFKMHWQIIVFVFVLLIFPFLFAFDAGNPDAKIRIGVNVIFALIVMGTLLCLKGWKRKSLACVSTLMAYAPNTIVLSYLRMDKIIMKSTDFWLVFNTNPAEASNLFATLSVDVFIWALAYTVLVILGLVWVFRIDDRKIENRWVGVAAVLFLVGVCAVNPFRSKVPMIDFYKSFYKYQKEQRDVAEFYKNRQNIILEVERLYPENEKNTILIIIGESQNRQHMQLYGYPRETNPLLSEIRDELTIYDDVCSSATRTLICMKEIMTFTNYEHPDMYKQEANIVELLNAGGYKTFWLDNQGVSMNKAFAIDTYAPTSYRTMAKQSDVYQESEVIDSILVRQLAEACEDTAQNKAIFLHLIGNHFEYSGRYEPEYDYFKDTIGMTTKFLNQLTEEDRTNVNSYDNATRYNDYIVRSCIETVRAIGGRSVMLYMSDHGEEIYDYQCMHGRSLERISPAQCEPPFILWMNGAYRESNDLVLDKDRPYSLDDLIYSIMDMAGIRYHLYDEKRSVYSTSFEPKERKVMGIPYQGIVDKYAEK